jgi:3-oxoacyl-[acyl-carrier protein] reductase
MSTPELQGRHALVTGAAGVIGEAITQALLERGCRVSMVDTNGARLHEMAARTPDRLHAQELDIRDPAEVDKVIADLCRSFGGIEVLVNNAGILSNNKATQTDAGEWREVMAVNLDGAFYVSRACLPVMRSGGWGRIINMCSMAMKTGGVTAGTAYTTSKSALGGLTFSLARETVRDGITVNGVAPAYVLTPMVTEQLSDAQREQLLRDIPVGRFCTGEEVAHTVAFLASPLSGFITGEIIDINGGFHLD